MTSSVVIVDVSAIFQFNSTLFISVGINISNPT